MGKIDIFERVKHDLYENVGKNIVVFAPRRAGKTTFVIQLALYFDSMDLDVICVSRNHNEFTRMLRYMDLEYAKGNHYIVFGKDIRVFDDDNYINTAHVLIYDDVYDKFDKRGTRNTLFVGTVMKEPTKLDELAKKYTTYYVTVFDVPHLDNKLCKTRKDLLYMLMSNRRYIS